MQPVKAADGQPARRQHSLLTQGKDALKAPRYAEIDLQLIALIAQLLKAMRLQAHQQRVYAVKQGIARNAAAAILTGQGGKGFSAKTVQQLYFIHARRPQTPVTMRAKKPSLAKTALSALWPR